MGNNVILKSIITCPHCKHQKEELMPEDACVYFYVCEKCNEQIKPIKGDCCVFCSYGSNDCPPIQENKKCC